MLVNLRTISIDRIFSCIRWFIRWESAGKITLCIIRRVSCDYRGFLPMIPSVTHVIFSTFILLGLFRTKLSYICQHLTPTVSNFHFSMQPGWPGNCSHFWPTKTWYCWSYQLHVQYPWDTTHRSATGTRKGSWTTNPLFHERLSRNHTTRQVLPGAAQTLPVEQILCYLWGPTR